jgi:hypothetical protein
MLLIKEDNLPINQFMLPIKAIWKSQLLFILKVPQPEKIDNKVIL